mgnify:FL=1
MYYLDTNTCIYYLNGRSQAVRNKILSTPPLEIGIPSVVKAELIFGAFKSQRRAETLENVEDFLKPFEVVPFNDEATYAYAEIRSEIEKSGQLIGPNDTLIAAIARCHQAILVTNNQKEFTRVPGLLVENWTEEPGTPAAT